MEKIINKKKRTMNNFDANKFRAILKTLRQMVRCPHCGSSFAENDLEMIAGMGPAYFVKMSCGHCGMNVMVSMVQMDEHKSSEIASKVNSVGMMMNNSAFQKNIEAETQPIDSDVLINVHQFLKGFDGDFKSMN